MKHFRTMLVGLGIGLGGVALGSVPGQPTLQAEGERHTVPVAVENTPTVNVRTLPAITGSVSITGQPVSVNVNTLPAVQLAPGTTVGVTGGNFTFSNTASTPIFTRDKDNPALAPFQITICAESSFGLCRGSFVEAFTIPLGHHAVIEYVTTSCSSTGVGAGVNQLAIRTTVTSDVTSNGVASHALDPGQQDPISNVVVGHQLTRIYADGGTLVSLDRAAHPNPPFGSATCYVVLSGYLVAL